MWILIFVKYVVELVCKIMKGGETMAYIITSGCIECGKCAKVCPVGAPKKKEKR